MLRQDRARVHRWHETRVRGKLSFQAPTLRVTTNQTREPISVKWDEKRRNQLQLAFQVRPELNFVNWLEEVWKNITSENIAGYILSSTYPPPPPVIMVHLYTSMAEIVIQACPSKGLSIQDIFEEVSRHNPEVFQHMVPSNYTPVVFWGAGHKKGSPGPLHIFVYDAGGEVAQRIVQEKVTIGSKKCLALEGPVQKWSVRMVQGIDPATQLRRDVPAVPCKAGRQLDNNTTKSANRAIRTQKKRAKEAAAALIAAKDYDGNVPMRESTPVAGPSTQHRRVKSGRYEALSEVAETSEDDVEIVSAGASEMEDGQHK
ncbi:hypothetical protein BC835DRAFT_1310868 [Cytidiella melzeri]|nr:hypothetical protein BC835DRAFT_1310868 [Cytidiella melzeri]